jgi:hypothetical protein
MRSVSAATAATDRFLIEGPGPKAWIHNYINDGRQRADGSPRQAGDASPMIYLVDQEPNSAIQMHFHQVDQYQIVIGGNGFIGRHPLAPITVHYTSAFTGYGPLAAGPDGLQYLTIRSCWDPGLRLLPEAMGERPPAGSYKMRQHTSVPASVLELDMLLALDRPFMREMMHEPEGDAKASLFALPPDCRDIGPCDSGKDRVYVVCAGSLSGTGANGHFACHFVPAGEVVTLTAGHDGVDILMLQFPNPQRN